MLLHLHCLPERERSLPKGRRGGTVTIANMEPSEALSAGDPVACLPRLRRPPGTGCSRRGGSGACAPTLLVASDFLAASFCALAAFSSSRRGHFMMPCRLQIALVVPLLSRLQGHRDWHTQPGPVSLSLHRILSFCCRDELCPPCDACRRQGHLPAGALQCCVAHSQLDGRLLESNAKMSLKVILCQPCLVLTS